VVSATRVAIMQELRGEVEPSLDEVLTRLEGSELILIEGFKAHDHPKIEARRRDSASTDPIAGAAPGVVAIAADHPTEAGGLPLFGLDDIKPIADFITRYTGLAMRHAAD
jgi:molybdopterin-guanine dinucleotide biosynthesis protein B